MTVTDEVKGLRLLQSTISPGLGSRPGERGPESKGKGRSPWSPANIRCRETRTLDSHTTRRRLYPIVCDRPRSHRIQLWGAKHSRLTYRQRDIEWSRPRLPTIPFPPAIRRDSRASFCIISG